MIKPVSLKPGDTIGIISPSGPVYDINRISYGREILEKAGFKTLLSNNCFLKYGYLAGEDKTRASDINTFFENKTVNGIICLRGGYGTLRILDMINYEIIKNNPKVFIGYSDITALHSAIHRYCNLITFHGPMIASDLADNEPSNLLALLNSICGNMQKSNFKLIPIKPGSTKGIVVGGNLSVICSLVGSSYIEDYTNKILFLEDIGEEPYKIDRMLQQLKHSGIMSKVIGVVLGQFTECEASDRTKSHSFEFVIKDFFSKFNFPVYCNLQAGHNNKKISIPLGCKIEILNDIIYFREEGVLL